MRTTIGSFDDAAILVSGGLQPEKLISELPSVELATGVDWQRRVHEYLTTSSGTYDTRGVIESLKTRDLIAEELSRLSNSPFPNDNDIERVRRAAAAYSIEAPIRRQISNDKRFFNAMHWRYRSGSNKWYLKRGLSSKIWLAEILMHFEREDWHIGLPKPRTLRLANGSQTRLQNSIGVWDVASFKGLEAEAIILVAGSYEPVSKANLYVAVSRARQGVCIVDAGADLQLPLLED
jgi:hypothetical protein